MAKRKWNPWLERRRVQNLVSSLDVFLKTRNQDGTERSIWISKFGLMVEWRSSIMHIDVAGWEVKYWTRETGKVSMAEGSFEPAIIVVPGDKVSLSFNSFHFDFPDGEELTSWDLQLFAVH